jgi:hypothetical protein
MVVQQFLEEDHVRKARAQTSRQDRLAAISRDFPDMPALMKLRMAELNSELFLAYKAAKSHWIQPNFSIMQMLCLAFWSCGPMANLEQLVNAITKNFPWLKHVQWFRSAEGEFDSERYCKQDCDLLHGNMTSHFASLLSRNHDCHHRLLETMNEGWEGEHDLPNYLPEREYVYRLVPGYKHDIFQDHDIVGKDSSSTRLHGLIQSRSSRASTTPMKMNDLSGVPFPETERPQLTLRGMPEEVRLITVEYSSAKQYVDEIF